MESRVRFVFVHLSSSMLEGYLQAGCQGTDRSLKSTRQPNPAGVNFDSAASTAHDRGKFMLNRFKRPNDQECVVHAERSLMSAAQCTQPTLSAKRVKRRRICAFDMRVHLRRCEEPSQSFSTEKMSGRSRYIAFQLQKSEIGSS